MAAKKKTPPKKSEKKASKQASLPTMEDRSLQELEALAEEYADIRDERMSLNEREVELNDELLLLMKKHKKAEYHHGDVHCWVKATDERVKVKIGELSPKQKKKESEDTAQETEEVETSGPEEVTETETEGAEV